MSILEATESTRNSTSSETVHLTCSACGDMWVCGCMYVSSDMLDLKLDHAPEQGQSQATSEQFTGEMRMGRDGDGSNIR